MTDLKNIIQMDPLLQNDYCLLRLPLMRQKPIKISICGLKPIEMSE